MTLRDKYVFDKRDNYNFCFQKYKKIFHIFFLTFLLLFF